MDRIAGADLVAGTIAIARADRFARTDCVTGAVTVTGTYCFADAHQIARAQLDRIATANDIAGGCRDRSSHYGQIDEIEG